MRMVAAILSIWMVWFSVQTADAQSLRKLGRYSAWTAFAHDGTGLCFIDAVPSGSHGEPRQSSARVQVTRYPDRPKSPEASIQMGLFLGANRLVSVSIDDRKHFELYSDGEHAWPSDERIDPKLIRAMQRGRTMRVTAATLSGAMIGDVYSLIGFSKALRRTRRCNAKRAK